MSQNNDGLSGQKLQKTRETDVTDVLYKYRWIAYFLLFDLTLWVVAIYFDRIGSSSQLQGIGMYDSIAVVTGAFATIFAVLGVIAAMGALIAALWRRYKVQKQKANSA